MASAVAEKGGMVDAESRADENEAFPGLVRRETARARIAWDCTDMKGTGSLTKPEIKALSLLLEQNWSDDDIDGIFKRCDVGKSGSINFAEFSQFWVAHKEEKAILAELKRDDELTPISRLGAVVSQTTPSLRLTEIVQTSCHQMTSLALANLRPPCNRIQQGKTANRW